MAVSAFTDRTIEQRMTALAHANLIRSHRAGLKVDLKSGRLNPAVVLYTRDPDLQTMKVYDVLRHIPHVADVGARNILRQLDISSSKTLGGLTMRQRRALIEYLTAKRGRAALRDAQAHNG